MFRSGSADQPQAAAGIGMAMAKMAKNDANNGSLASLRPEWIKAGIALALAGHFSMSVMDACGKALGEGYAISQIVLVRNLFGALLVLIYAASTAAGLAQLQPRLVGLLIVRTVLGLATGFLFFASLVYLPLADAFALSFVAPMLVTALSVPLLGEHVSLRRWIAVAAGFAGVLVIVQPGTASFRVQALLPLGAAFCYAVVMLVGRRMTREVPVSAVLFWPSVGAVLVTLLLMPSQWRTPDAFDAGLFLLMGVIGTLSMALMTQAYRLAPAAALAPFEYSILLWGVMFGWIFWQDIPGPNVWAGSIVLIVAGWYILRHEA